LNKSTGLAAALGVAKIYKIAINVIKLFATVIYEFSLSARVFVPGELFQPSLMFAGKAGAYLSESYFRCSL
jgi:hypothetical protein